MGFLLLGISSITCSALSPLNYRQTIISDYQSKVEWSHGVFDGKVNIELNVLATSHNSSLEVEATIKS